MTIDISKIRINSIVEIKEKIKKNPGFMGYAHPCNKERLEDMKRLMFVSGNEFTQWMQNNGILKNPVDIKRKERKKTVESADCKTNYEYSVKCAINAEFKDATERSKVSRWNSGVNIPLEFNEDCSSHFGEFTEKLMIHYYPGAKKMPYGNPGFDYLWKDEDGKEIKIDNKGGCLIYRGGNRSPYCNFNILHNNVADRFILSGWDNRENLNPLFALEFKKNDLVRYGYGLWSPKIEFWERETFTVTYTDEKLDDLYEHMIDIDWLQESKNKE